MSPLKVRVITAHGQWKQNAKDQPHHYTDHRRTVTEFPDKIDILWVVDNSGSMAKHQDAIADEVRGFLNKIQQTGLNFHLGVTTTDMSSRPDLECNPNAPNPARGRLVGPERYLVRTSSNLYGKFSQAIRQGQCGSNAERGLEAMETALTTSDNGDFLRPEAMLVVIFLTDEDDKEIGRAHV